MSRMNIQPIVLKNFLGIHRSADPFDVQNVYCQDIDNLRLDNAGVVKSGWGYSRASFPDGTEYRENGLTGSIIEMFSLTDADGSYYVAITDDSKLWLYNSTLLLWELQRTFTYFDMDNYSLVRRNNSSVGLLTGNTKNHVSYVIKKFTDQFQNAYTGVDENKLPITGSFDVNISSLPKPDIRVFNAIATDFGFPDELRRFYDGYYFVRIAYEYDGQWSLPSDKYDTFWVGNKDAVKLILTLPNTLDRRITAVRVFRTKNDEGKVTSEDVYRLWTEFRINDDVKPTEFLGQTDSDAYFTGVLTAVTKTLAKTDCSTVFAIPNDKLNTFLVKIYAGSTIVDSAYIGVARIADFVSDTSVTLENLATAMSDGSTYTLVLAEGWFADTDNDQYIYTVYDMYNNDLSSAEEMYANLGYSTSRKQERNAAIGTLTANRQWIANFYNGTETVKSILEASSISGDGIPEYDKFQGAQIDFSQYGATEITGLAEWRNYLLVFTDAHLFQLRIDVLTNMTVQQAFSNVCLTDKRSIITIQDRVYFMTTNGPAVFENGRTQYFEEIVDFTDYPMWGYDVNNCISVYDKDHDAWYILFPASAMVFCYRITQRAWTRKSLKQTARAFADFISDTPYFVSVRDLLQFDSGITMNSKNAVQELVTKQFNFPDGFQNMVKYRMAYKSDKAFMLELRDENNTVQQTYTIPASSTKTFIENEIYAGLLMNSFNVRISATGADLEIYQITILIDGQPI